MRIVNNSDPKKFLIEVSEDPGKEVSIPRVGPVGCESYLTQISDLNKHEC